MLPIVAVALLLGITDTATALPSTRIFNTASTDQWIDELCDTNSTCQDTAERCYSNFKLARTFVAAVNNSDNKPTLSSRCKQQRDSFDKCAEEATLNATWLSISGSNYGCRDSFLKLTPGRSRSHFRRHRRQSNRRLPSYASRRSGDYPNWSRYNGKPDKYGLIESEFDPNLLGYGEPNFNQREYRNARMRRRNMRGRWRRSRRRVWGLDSSKTRVKKFIDNLEMTYPEAKRSFTKCMLREEGLMLANGTLDRSRFIIWAQAAYINMADVSEAVTTAMATCDEADDEQVSTYMQCWGQACVDAWPN